jgi:hypothetical protein
MSVYKEGELVAARALLDGFIARMPKMTPFPLDTSEKQVLVGMAGTALNRLGAIRALIEIGALVEATILARSLIELQISASYIAFGGTDSEGRARRFLMFEAVQRSKAIDRVLGVTTGSGLGPAEIGSRDRERLLELQSSRDAALAEYSDMEKASKKGWAGLTYADMIRAVDNRDLQDDLWFVYHHIYFSFSEYAHPTPTGIRHVIPGADPGGTLLPFGVPLYGTCAAGNLASLAARAGGVSALLYLDLIDAFVRAIPADAITPPPRTSGQRLAP